MSNLNEKTHKILAALWHPKWTFRTREPLMKESETNFEEFNVIINNLSDKIHSEIRNGIQYFALKERIPNEVDDKSEEINTLTNIQKAAFSLLHPKYKLRTKQAFINEVGIKNEEEYSKLIQDLDNLGISVAEFLRRSDNTKLIGMTTRN